MDKKPADMSCEELTKFLESERLASIDLQKLILEVLESQRKINKTIHECLDFLNAKTEKIEMCIDYLDQKIDLRLGAVPVPVESEELFNKLKKAREIITNA